MPGLVTSHKHKFASFYKTWHCVEPRGELGPDTNIWEGRHERGMVLFFRVNTEYDSTAHLYKRSDKLWAQAWGQSVGHILLNGRDLRLSQGRGCGVRKEGRGVNLQGPMLSAHNQTNLVIYLFVSFSQDLY